MTEESIFVNIARSSYTCKRCGEGTFVIPYPYAYCMGHIYSEKGVAEYFISKLCEWCFDEIADIEELSINGK